MYITIGNTIMHGLHIMTSHHDIHGVGSMYCNMPSIAIKIYIVNIGHACLCVHTALEYRYSSRSKVGLEDGASQGSTVHDHCGRVHVYPIAILFNSESLAVMAMSGRGRTVRVHECALQGKLECSAIL